ncbi:hypothetical protein F511_23932 [Dorcoceras hygrometricum]|uniref:Uncharacterized protein n=1 Tax=Dorcoceras hygrometricum TaxID=472368 RepID=A0A2Z7AH82_9LAMI|nr:hypothetical protein F511_23932 [Dorcoceras hygrometricum]
MRRLPRPAAALPFRPPYSGRPWPEPRRLDHPKVQPFPPDLLLARAVDHKAERDTQMEGHAAHGEGAIAPSSWFSHDPSLNTHHGPLNDLHRPP